VIKKILIRTAVIAVFSVIIIGAVLALYVWRTWDKVWNVPSPIIHASTDPAVIARGEYLVYGPAHCVECHTGSFADLLKIGEGQKVALKGGTRFAAPPLGAIYSKNLTPDPQTGIGRYTDGQIARMMRFSVRPDGRASVQPLMPFHNMSDEDMVAIISYLRAQPPVRNQVPRDEWTTIGKVIRSLSATFKPREPENVTPPARTPPEATKERGEYLARYVANCVGCHTKRDDMTFVATAPDFAGGEEMEPANLPGAERDVHFVTPNITPAPGSGLTKFPDRATFIARFKNGGRHHAGSPMPWEAFARMSESDIAALYDFLHSLPAEAGPTGEPTFRKTD
jgi:mono/diheme cytochrome c family protein